MWNKICLFDVLKKLNGLLFIQNCSDSVNESRTTNLFAKVTTVALKLKKLTPKAIIFRLIFTFFRTKC